MFKGFSLPNRKNQISKTKGGQSKIETKRLLTVYIPGIGHDLRKHATVLVRGGVYQIYQESDTILCAGTWILNLQRIDRKNRRSKYGKKSPLFGGKDRRK